MAAASSIWQPPSAIRGRTVPRARNDPTLLPIPSPTRNTARMIEKVYTVPPSISDNKPCPNHLGAQRAHPRQCDLT